MTRDESLDTSGKAFGAAPDGAGNDAEACKAALQPAFEKVTAGGAVSMGSAAGAEIPEELEALLTQAVADGWDRAVAEDVIRALAREQLGAHGASFD
jgi:hypothetical protein